MTTYNTRNPLGSTSPKDLYDNAENLDRAVNASADTWVDRFGVVRLTAEGALKRGVPHSYETASSLNADSSKPAGSWAVVVNDTADKNGYYQRQGSAWVKTSLQPAAKEGVDGARYIVHGALTYQYFDRSAAAWIISHDSLTIMRGAGRGQVTIPAADRVVVSLNRMYYVDLMAVSAGDTVEAQLTTGNADNYPTYGVGAFVDDLKLPLFSYRGGRPGGLLFNRTLDQSNNWPSVVAQWFKTSTATVIAYDSVTRTLSWSGQITCGVPLASTRRNILLAAHSVVIPEGNYKVVWLDLRQLPNDVSSVLDPALLIRVGSYDEGLSSDTAYRGFHYQIPLFAVGFGVARSAPGFFDGQVDGVVFAADTTAIQEQVDGLSTQVSDLANEMAAMDVMAAVESRAPVYLRDGVLYRHDALGERVVSDATPKQYTAPPYWRGNAVISVLDRPTLGPTTAVAINQNGKLIHPSAENLVTILAGGGQSNARGTRGNVGATIPLDPTYKSIMQMFSGGADMDVRLGVLAADFDAPIDPSSLMGFQALRSVDTVDNTGTTMLEGAAASLHQDLNKQLSLLSNYLYFTAARGGTSLAGLVKGTVPYQNFMTAVQRAKDIASRLDKHVWLPAVLWIHGESDTVNVNYATQLIAFWEELNTDVKTITGQLADVQMMMVQPSSFQSFRAPLEMLRAAELNSNFHVVGPGYPLPFYTDYLHYDRAGHFKLGEYCWKVVRNVLYGDRSWKPLRPESVRFNGTNQIEIEFHVPVGRLALDAEATDKDGNWGFELFDEGVPVAISSKALEGNMVTLTAASALTAGGSSVRYALNGQTTPRTAEAIPRGRLRDSDTAPSLVDGMPLHNWCVHFEKNF